MAIIEDNNGFILNHKIMYNQTDEKIAVDFLKDTMNRVERPITESLYSIIQTLDSKNINTYVGKAKAYSGMGEHGKAIKIYDYLLIKGNARQMSAVKKLKDEEMEKLGKKAKGYEIDIGILGRR